MSKRNAPDTAAGSCSHHPELSNSLSPNPRPHKKRKKESLAAARTWHTVHQARAAKVPGGDGGDGGNDDGDVVDDDIAVGGGKLSPAAAAVATSANSGCAPTAIASIATTSTARSYENDGLAAASAAAATTMHKTSNAMQSSLYHENTRPRKMDVHPGGGGQGGKNNFLKSLRTGNLDDTANLNKLSNKNEDSTEDDVASASSSLTVPSLIMNGSTAKRYYYCGIVGKALLYLMLLVVNIATGIVSMVVLNGLSLSYHTLHEQHMFEVTTLKNNLATSRNVEALLRSSVRVLDEEIQMKMEAWEEELMLH